MDIRYFESLISIVEQGSIARAARAQNLTAAAVGQRIAALERHFKVPLLNRSGHKATPTENCLNLLAGAHQIVNEFNALNEKMQIETSTIAGRVVLGAISSAMVGLLPNPIHHLAEVTPDLILKIKPGTSKSLLADLNARNIDAAIIAQPPWKLPLGLKSTSLRVEPLVLLSYRARGDSIRDKLEKNPYICYDSESWGGLRAMQFLRDQKIRIEPIYELDTLETIEKLVLKGMGVSLAPFWAGLDLNQPGLEAEIIEGEGYARKVILASPENSPRNRLIESVTAALKLDYGSNPK